MSTTIVHIRVKPEHRQAFVQATEQNRDASRQEPGNLRFDFLQSREDPERFVLYEAYENDEAARAHKETDHYQRWKAEVEEMMAEPRRGDPFDMI